jgi:hypothetical protein
MALLSRDFFLKDSFTTKVILMILITNTVIRVNLETDKNMALVFKNMKNKYTQGFFTEENVVERVVLLYTMKVIKQFG